MAIEIGNTTDRAERHAIDAARAKLVDAELAPIRRERFQLEREITEQLGLAADYNATFELLSGVSLAALRDQCAAFLRDTQSMWDDTLPAFAKRVLGMDTASLRRADALGAVSRARVR